MAEPLSADLKRTDNAFAAALQTDGKIVVVGFTSDDGNINDFALARFNSNGSLDSSFGTGGKVITDFFGGNDTALAVAIQQDGKIVVSGSASINVGTPIIALARYNTDGSLDVSFATGGKLVTNITNFADRSFAIGLQPDGKIVVAGFSFDPISSALSFALVRYNSNGSLDATFGMNGIVTTAFPSVLSSQARCLALQTDGKIVVGGSGINFDGNTQSIVVARYNANGTLDGSFGNGGADARVIANNIEARDIAIQQNGKIVAALGSNFAITSDFTLIRYNPNGSLDATFGSGGVVTTDFSNNMDVSSGVAIQADGKILAAGVTIDGNSNGQFGLARYEGDSTDFDLCLQDDRNGNMLELNSTTGEYRFIDCRKGLILTGIGSVRIRFCKVELSASKPDHSITGLANTCTKAGTASVKIFPSNRVFTISDRDMTNNTCACR